MVKHEKPPKNAFYCLMLLRDNVTIVREIDRLFNVTAVLSGWESVAASQQDAFSWRALAKHLSIFATRSLMHRALQVSYSKQIRILFFHFLPRLLFKQALKLGLVVFPST